MEKENNKHLCLTLKLTGTYLQGRGEEGMGMRLNLSAYGGRSQVDRQALRLYPYQNLLKLFGFRRGENARGRT